MSCYYDKIQDLLPKCLFEGDSPIFTAPTHYEDHMNIIGEKVANDLLDLYGDDTNPGKIQATSEILDSFINAAKEEINTSLP
eukprot:Pgem_evm1s1697